MARSPLPSSANPSSLPAARAIRLVAALVILVAGAIWLARARAWSSPSPAPQEDSILVDGFDRDSSDAAVRSRLADLRGDIRMGHLALDRGIRKSPPAALRVSLFHEDPPGGAFGWRTGDSLPSNWSGHEGFACMTRSLVVGKDGRPRTEIGEIGDRGDYLSLEVEAPDLRTGLWRTVRLRDERNRRYLSWSGWSRWQVDLRGDSGARGIDWRRVRAVRVATAGAPDTSYFLYLDDCRLERRWRPVQTAEYFFLGVNMWDIWGRGEGPLTGEDLRRPFDEALRRDIRTKLGYLAAKRIPVLRIFLDDHLEIDPGKGLFEDEILRRIDFMIDTIRARRWPVRLMISLSTGYDVQRGASWYAKQSTGTPAERTRAFYVEPRLRAVYKDQMRHVLEHVNAGSGVAWKDEPVIWSWDVSNEPRILYGTPGTTYASRTREMVAWYAEMSAALRAIDRRHRIISGTFYSGDGVPPHDDYDDWNIWELFSLDTIDALSVQSYVGPHLLRTGPKPLLLEEFGYGGRYFVEPTDAKRADNYRWMLLSDEKVYLAGVGALLWQMNWNHGDPDGKEIHADPPSWEPRFHPGARNRSLDLFEFYLGKYNRLEVEPEIEEGWSDLGGLRWHHRSIHPPMRAVDGRRFAAGYVISGADPEPLARIRAALGRGPARGYVENRIFIPASGRFRLEARVRRGAGNAPAFGVRVDGGPLLALEASVGAGSEEAGGWRRAAPRAPLALRYGKHTIRVEALRPGGRLDGYRLVRVPGPTGP